MSTTGTKTEIDSAIDPLSQPWREKFHKENALAAVAAAPLAKTENVLTLPVADTQAHLPVFQVEKLDILPIRPAPRRNRKTGRR